MLYPTTWLNLVLAPWSVYTVYAVGHLAFSAVGFTLLARAIGLGRGEAVVAGTAWMLSGPAVSLVNLWHHLAGAAWMPWVVLAAHRLARRPSAARVLAFAVCLGLQVLAGSGDMVLLTAAFVGAWWLAVGPGWQRVGRAAVPVVLGVLLAAALSAGQWLPTLELASGGTRRDLPEAWRTEWSVPPAGLARVVVPLDASGRVAYGGAAHVAMFDGYRQPFFGSLYLGVVALALAAAALAPGRFRRLALALAAIAALALLVSMGRHTPVYALAVQLVPGAGHFRFPTKVTIVAAFSVAMLSGIGLRSLRGRPSGRLFAASVALTSAVVLIATSALFGPALQAAIGWGFLMDRSGAEDDALPSAIRLLDHALLAGLAAAALLKARPNLAWPRILAGVCLVADLLLAHHDLHSTAPPTLLAVTPPVLSAVDVSDHARTYVYEYEILRAPPKNGWDEGARTRSRSRAPGSTRGLSPRSPCASIPSRPPRATGAWRAATTWISGAFNPDGSTSSTSCFGASRERPGTGGCCALEPFGPSWPCTPTDSRTSLRPPPSTASSARRFTPSASRGHGPGPTRSDGRGRWTRRWRSRP